MKWLMRVSFLIACVFCENTGRAQAPTVSVTAFSSSTGATIVATASIGTSATLQFANTIQGPWSSLATHNFGTNATWLFQDTGATFGGQRYYRLSLTPLWLGGGQVYSVNIAGLVRLNAASGLILLANPLLATNNTVAEAFRNPENGFSLYRLTPTGFEANNYLVGWTAPSMPFAPGEGFFFRNPSGSPRTLAFFGEAPLGSQTVAIPAGQSLRSSKFPVSGPLQSELGFPVLDLDVVYLWSGTSFSPCFYDESFGWEPSEPSLSVGRAFWLVTSVARNWTRVFSPNFSPLLANPPADLGGGDSSPDLAPAGGPPVQVNFFTYNLNTSFGRVFDPDGTTPAGASCVGQLFAGSANSEASLAAVGSAVVFGSGPAAGYLNSDLVSVPGISAGQPIYLQLRVWESALGATYAAAVANGGKNGRSAIFSVTAVAPPDSGPTVPPPSANGFASFNLTAPLSPPLQVRVNGVLAGTNGVTVTNAAMLSLETAYPGGAIFYTLNGTHPGVGTPYTGPVLVSTSVVVRAIAYDAGYTESVESDPVPITVGRSPVFTLQPVTQTVLVGQSAVFNALAQGAAPVTYQWYFNGSPLPGGSARSNSFTRSNAQLANAGAYHVVASNLFGSATSAVAGLTVLLRPSITTQPAGTNVFTGQNATFCVNVIGSAPLAFQWRKNGVNIPGATNSCYAITNVQATNAGAYSVVVANGADAITSAEAELVLGDLPTGPPPEDLFANRNGLFGNPGALEVNNVGATKEAGEPDHAGKPGGASVWYAWTMPATGIATLRTSGSAFDTLLAVYRGTGVAALTPVAANEDGGGFLTSAVRFNATNGVEYQVAVDGFAAAQGTFVLSWTLEVTAQVLPVITNQPQSQTVLAGSDAPFSVGASGSSLKYQWYFNGARLTNATNATFIRTNVQSADVGYYAVAVTNSQNRGLFSEAAVLEIGPFANVRSTDKVEDLLGEPQPAPPGGRGPFQPASSGFASVAIGSLGTQILNTTNSTTSFRETNHCGVIGGSSRWFKLKPAANGLMSIDTFGSTFDTVLAAYTGDPLLGGYPTRLIDCNNNAATDARWSRVLYSATNAIEYLVAVDGAASAAGTVQLNWSLGLPPVIVSNPPPLTPLVGEGEALQLTTALTNGLPPPKLQWYLNGQPITDATNATYAVGAAQRLSGGTYTVVAYNSLGMVTSLVANVTVEVPLKLNLQPVLENGKVHFRVSGTASQTFILQGSTNFVNWQPLYTNSAAGAPVSFDDRSTTNRARRYYRALPWP